MEAAIELRDGQRVEWSRSGSMAYENARNAEAGAYRLTKERRGTVMYSASGQRTAYRSNSLERTAVEAEGATRGASAG